MNKDMIDQSDAQKLHSEINQILSLRIQLMLAAVTITGVYFAFASSTDDSQRQSLFVGSAGVLLVLIALAYASAHMRRMLRVLTAYLRATGLSEWEKAWAKFKRCPPPCCNTRWFIAGYSKPIAYTITGCGFLITLFPWFKLWLAHGSSLTFTWSAVCLQVIPIAFLIVLLVMLYFSHYDKDAQFTRDMLEYWENLPAARAVAGGDG